MPVFQHPFPVSAVQLVLQASPFELFFEVGLSLGVQGGHPRRTSQGAPWGAHSRKGWQPALAGVATGHRPAPLRCSAISGHWTARSLRQPCRSKGTGSGCGPGSHAGRCRENRKPTSWMWFSIAGPTILRYRTEVGVSCGLSVLNRRNCPARASCTLRGGWDTCDRILRSCFQVLSRTFSRLGKFRVTQKCRIQRTSLCSLLLHFNVCFLIWSSVERVGKIWFSSNGVEEVVNGLGDYRGS